ncbi:hypothetical protein MPS_2612 [Mycobacterium pseudoshottsii JCM 15466]|nr:hypothetical protein MPS_2612 [Mycobacterium pseudoshottsii JCM 15466]
MGETFRLSPAEFAAFTKGKLGFIVSSLLHLAAMALRQFDVGQRSPVRVCPHDLALTSQRRARQYRVSRS